MTAAVHHTCLASVWILEQTIGRRCQGHCCIDFQSLLMSVALLDSVKQVASSFIPYLLRFIKSEGLENNMSKVRTNGSGSKCVLKWKIIVLSISGPTWHSGILAYQLPLKMKYISNIISPHVGSPLGRDHSPCIRICIYTLHPRCREVPHST